MKTYYFMALCIVLPLCGADDDTSIRTAASLNITTSDDEWSYDDEGTTVSHRHSETRVSLQGDFASGLHVNAQELDHDLAARAFVQQFCRDSGIAPALEPIIKDRIKKEVESSEEKRDKIARIVDSDHSSVDSDDLGFAQELVLQAAQQLIAEKELHIDNLTEEVTKRVSKKKSAALTTAVSLGMTFLVALIQGIACSCDDDGTTEMFNATSTA